MKAKNIVGKIYVSPMPIWGVLKHFVEAFKLQFVEQTGINIKTLHCTAIIHQNFFFSHCTAFVNALSRFALK